jgi:hypothetical protein
MNIVTLKQQEISEVYGGGVIMEVFQITGGIVGCFAAAAWLLGKPRVPSYATLGNRMAGYFSKEYFKVAGGILAIVLPCVFVFHIIESIIYRRDHNETRQTKKDIK